MGPPTWGFGCFRRLTWTTFEQPCDRQVVVAVVALLVVVLVS